MGFLNSFKEQLKEAELLAEKKQLEDAIAIAQNLINTWYEQPSFSQLLFRKLFLENDLNKLQKQLKKWRKQLADANKLVVHGKMLVEQDSGNPLEIHYLTNAIDFYQHYLKIICDPTVSQSIEKYQKELDCRNQFKKLIVEAELHRENRFFQNAIAIYRQAEQLYSTEQLKNAIATCEAQVKQEQIYSRILTSVYQAQNAGKLKIAIALLNSALTSFSRSDGIKLLEQLQNTLQGKEKFRDGLKAEKSGNFKQAETLYQAALPLLSDSTDCQIRLAIVFIKAEEWVLALNCLKDIQVEQAAYLRGFALAKQGNLVAAAREWQALSGERIQIQRENLETISQWQRLLKLQNIQQLVEEKNFALAKTASIEFIQYFGDDSLIVANLNEHIQPSIAASLWQNSDWGMIRDTVEKAWIIEPNIINLHNWTVATYYRARNDVNSTQIESVKLLIVALSTALANLHHDLALKDIPWMAQAVDLQAVSLELKQRLSDTIDSFKDQNTSDYLELRDCYRLETVALGLMGNPPSRGIRVKELLITPGCHNRYLESWKDIVVEQIDKQRDKQNILQALYTPWGLAVAACVEGDISRAIELKPFTQPVGIEIFACSFVAYHEGCEWLKQRKWQNAIVPLNQTKTLIKANGEWEEQINRLCGYQRQGISELTEHLDFAQFWYSLLGNQAARSYLSEYKAEEIREKLINQKISCQQALKQLREIPKIDATNPIVIDLIERVEYQQEIEDIQKLFNEQRYDQAIKKAKYSHHQQVKFSVAKFLIESLVESVKKELADYQIIQQLGQWAYEICPDEPAFQQVYQNLKIGY